MGEFFPPGEVLGVGVGEGVVEAALIDGTATKTNSAAREKPTINREELVDSLSISKS